MELPLLQQSLAPKVWVDSARGGFQCGSYLSCSDPTAPSGALPIAPSNPADPDALSPGTSVLLLLHTSLRARSPPASFRQWSQHPRKRPNASFLR
eukprot:6461423-Amphidinium_carterae.2